MNYYKRENYLRKIRGFYEDTGLIKVITGVRRCGIMIECIIEAVGGTMA